MNHPCHEDRWGGHVRVVVHDWGSWEPVPIQTDDVDLEWRICKRRGCDAEQTRVLEHKDEEVSNVE